MFDLKASNDLSLMGAAVCKGVQSGCCFFLVAVNACACATRTVLSCLPLPLMAALAAEAEALLSYEISAACVEFFAPLAG